MGISAVIDTAIGLVLMYLVLSLFCTTINEAIANAVNLRARTLNTAMQQIIDDPTLRTLFYNHGLIDGAKVAATGGSTKPQVLDKAHPSYLDAKDVAMALIDSTAFLGSNDAKAIPDMAAIQSAIAGNKILDSNIRDALVSGISQANGDIVKLRTNLAQWFDASMDRLSGDYKRKLQWISMFVGLALAIFFNADTLFVARAFWQDPALSASVSQSAAAFASTNPTDQSCAGQTNPVTCATQRMTALNADLRPFPLGWSAALMPKVPMEWIYKVFGIIMTAIALTLGAPFWFDLLTQFVNLRGSGNKPQSSTSWTRGRLRSI